MERHRGSLGLRHQDLGQGRIYLGCRIFNMWVKSETACNRPDSEFRQAVLVARECRRYEKVITSSGPQFICGFTQVGEGDCLLNN